MKQYLVEVPDETKVVESTNTLIFDAAPATERTCKKVKGMTLYTEANVKTIAEENLKRGHEEAWELARKIAAHPDDGGYRMPELGKIFGEFISVNGIFNNNTYAEAIQKVKAWEEEKKTVHVGDIVLDADDRKGVVLRTGAIYCAIMYADGAIGYYKKIVDLKKTGKTADIPAILGQIKEA